MPTSPRYVERRAPEITVRRDGSVRNEAEVRLLLADIRRATERAALS